MLKLLKKILNVFINFLFFFYRYIISPIIGNNCRFYPSCSDYSKECFEKFNLFKAFFLSIKRILKCNPFGSSGFDPVPDKELNI